jgi:hypothetical protein
MHWFYDQRQWAGTVRKKLVFQIGKSHPPNVHIRAIDTGSKVAQDTTLL